AHLARVCVYQVNAGLRQVVPVADVGTATPAVWLCYGRDPPAVGAVRDGPDDGVLLKDNALETLARDILEEQLRPGPQVGVKLFGARSCSGSPPGGGERFAVR